MLMGVHTNMCVLGRPFGLRQLARHGKEVVLVRDLTDTMYNSRSWPYVSHFEGTNRIIEHVEKYVCPTITSADLTGQPAFTFQPDDRPRAVFVIGDDEYQTEKTLPAFANSELEPLGVRCTFVIADPKTPHDFQGIEALDDADLMVVSVRRRAPTAEQMRMIRKYVESGKSVVGIRTASHAFDARGKAPEGHAEWRTFDPDVLGGHYTGHHANELEPKVTAARGAESHHGRCPDTVHRPELAVQDQSPGGLGPRPANGRDPRPSGRARGLGQPGGIVSGVLHVARPSGRLRQHRVSPLAAQCRLLGDGPPAFGRTDLDLEFDVAIDRAIEAEATRRRWSQSP